MSTKHEIPQSFHLHTRRLANGLVVITTPEHSGLTVVGKTIDEALTRVVVAWHSLLRAEAENAETAKDLAGEIPPIGSKWRTQKGEIVTVVRNRQKRPPGWMVWTDEKRMGMDSHTWRERGLVRVDPDILT